MLKIKENIYIIYKIFITFDNISKYLLTVSAKYL